MANTKLAALIAGLGLTAAAFGQSAELNQGGSAPARYTVTRLSNIPGGTAAYPVTINAFGEIAGTAYDGGTCDAGCPVIWSGKTPTFLGKLPNFIYGSVNGMNDRGQVVGTMYQAANTSDGIEPEVGTHGTSRAIVWNDTQPTLLGELPGNWPTNSATGINHFGEVVGWAHSAAGPYRAVRWHGTLPTPLPTECYFGPIINGPGLIACTTEAQDPSIVEAREATLLPQLGGGAVPNGINDTGLIVGSSVTQSGMTHAVVWKHERIIDISPQGATYSAANGVNAQGHIVGGSVTSNGQLYAAYWASPDAKPQNLNMLISARDAAKYQLTEAMAINEQCAIVAWGSQGASAITYAFVLTLKPEFKCE